MSWWWNPDEIPKGSDEISIVDGLNPMEFQQLESPLEIPFTLYRPHQNSIRNNRKHAKPPKPSTFDRGKSDKYNVKMYNDEVFQYVLPGGELLCLSVDARNKLGCLDIQSF